VYQDAQGGIYITNSGFGIGSGSLTTEQIILEDTLIDEFTSINIVINGILAPEKYVIVQMDEDHNLIARSEFDQGTTPDLYAIKPETAYIIVETHRRTPNTEQSIIREIFSLDGDMDETERYFNTFSVREDGIAIRHTTHYERLR